jgi:hypothetical protein
MYTIGSGVTFLAPSNVAFEMTFPAGVKQDPFFASPNLKIDTLLSCFIGPPAVNFSTFLGEEVTSIDGSKRYAVSRDSGIYRIYYQSPIAWTSY